MTVSTLQRLQHFEDEARATNNPHRYLELLGPLHKAWHTVPATRRRVGLLLFHWHVIAHFQALKLDKTLAVKPYAVADFSRGGQFASDDWNSAMTGVPDATSLDGLVTISEAIESWHNEAHMEIGMATGAPMMDPAVNILYTPFWNLHFFINAQFEAQLTNYATAEKPTAKKAADVVAAIESQSHPYVGRI